MMKKKIIMICILCLTTFHLVGCHPTNTSETSASTIVEEVQLSLWNDTQTKQDIIDYVNAITEENHEDYIPVADRIAVFDMDGTLVGEHAPIYFDWVMYCERVLDPSFEASEKQLQVASDILHASRNLIHDIEGIPDNVEEDHYLANGEVYAGMTTEEFRDYVSQFLENETDCYEGLTFKESYFRPMKELVEYLEAHDFTVYIVSGTDRDAVRVFASTFLDIPLRQIIGSDFYTVGSNQEDQSYLEHQFAEDETVLRSDTPIIKNVKMSKVMQISQEIGQQPVLAFGNSSGDYSMYMYTTSNNIYRAEAYCLVPDDDEREYAYRSKVESITNTCEENGWHIVSMKDDFKEIYGEKISKNIDHTPWLDRMEQLLSNKTSTNE